MRDLQAMLGVPFHKAVSTDALEGAKSTPLAQDQEVRKFCLSLQSQGQRHWLPQPDTWLKQ